MKEQLLDIVKIIDSCAKARKGTRISPIARVHCVSDGQPDNYWFTNSDINPRLLGNVGRFGHFVSKNSNVAIKLQTMVVGDTYEYSLLNHIKRVVHHCIQLENRANFQDQSITIAGDEVIYQYRNISEFLSELQQNQEDIVDTKNHIAELEKQYAVVKSRKGTPNELRQIKRSINEWLTKYRVLTLQQEDLKNITIYIRKQGEMRYSQIVDPIQTRIKSGHLFDGKTVIIDGGPGTGKSTTMIHRLAYLTDISAINEDEAKGIFHYKLNSAQRNQLLAAIKSHRDWMFFSPSPMLRDYLAAAMMKEGLTNTYQKVWDWTNYCRKILQDNYKLIGSDTGKAPFSICPLDGNLFCQGGNIINEFLNFYLNELREIRSLLPELETNGPLYKWRSTAKGILQKFEGSENFDLAGFISLFNSLESVYASDCKSLLSDKRKTVNDLAEELCSLIEENEELKTDIEDLLDLASDESIEFEETIVESDDEDKSGDLSENVLSEKQKALRKAVESWLQFYCDDKSNINAKNSDMQEFMSELILPLISDKYNDKIQRIRELMVFERFAKYTKGVRSIMLNGLPTRYKRFRSHLMRNKHEGCDLKLLRDIMQRKNGKELHRQEQSLLLGFINNLVKLMKRTPGMTHDHVYIEAYEMVSRPIIGIDEATDFSTCDIYAMHSLLSREFNSLTLCGDRMQRLTSYGITDWSDLESILPNVVQETLKTSYRQSKKLLEVARQMYTDTLGETPKYRAFMQSKKVPAPLVLVNNDEHTKIEWIAKRISEVYRAYGEQLPSIAIFVNDKGYIPNFINNLSVTPFFKENNVKITDGSDNSTKAVGDHICVYPIDIVKGMEFDVVFFHNIDNSSEDTETMKRYIYVGVSRAAFFLGITLSKSNKEITKYFEDNKDWFKI